MNCQRVALFCFLSLACVIILLSYSSAAAAAGKHSRARAAVASSHHHVRSRSAAAQTSTSARSKADHLTRARITHPRALHREHKLGRRTSPLGGVGGDIGPSCSAVKCQNGATCVDEAAGFYCQCKAGYEGLLCEYAAFSKADWVYPDLLLKQDDTVISYYPAEAIVPVEEISTLLVFGTAVGGSVLSAGNFSVDTLGGQSFVMAITYDGAVTGLSLLPAGGGHAFVSSAVLRVSAASAQDESSQEEEEQDSSEQQEQSSAAAESSVSPLVVRVLAGSNDGDRFAARIAMLSISMPNSSNQQQLHVKEDWVVLGYPDPSLAGKQSYNPTAESVLLSTDRSAVLVSGSFPCDSYCDHVHPMDCSFNVANQTTQFTAYGSAGHFLARINVESGSVEWLRVSSGETDGSRLSALPRSSALLWATTSTFNVLNDSTMVVKVLDQIKGDELASLSQPSVYVQSVITLPSDSTQPGAATTEHVLLFVSAYLPTVVDHVPLPVNMSAHPLIQMRTLLMKATVTRQDQRKGSAAAVQLSLSLVKVLDPVIVIPVNPFGPWSALAWAEKDSIVLMTDGWAHYADFGDKECQFWNGPALLAQLSTNGDIIRLTRAGRSSATAEGSSEGRALAFTKSGAVAVAGNYWGSTWTWGGVEMHVRADWTDQSFVAFYSNPFKQ